MSTADLYNTLGIELSGNGDNLRGDCPYCETADKFAVQKETGQYRCLYCNETGNTYSLLGSVWENEADRDQNLLKTLATNRGLPISSLVAFGVSWIERLGSLVIPQWTIKGKVANLCRIVVTNNGTQVSWKPSDPIHPSWKLKLFGLPGLPINLHAITPRENAESVVETTEDIWLVEGPWDGMALWTMLRQSVPIETPLGVSRKFIKSFKPSKWAETQAIVCTPGCGSFEKKWLPLFAGKKVHICFDNDHDRMIKVRTKGSETIRKINPAQEGYERTIRLLMSETDKPSEITTLQWSEDGTWDKDLDAGYDLRDLYCSAPEKTNQHLAFIFNHQIDVDPDVSEEQTETPPEKIEAVACTSFDSLIQTCEECLYVTEDFRDTFCVALAAVISTNIPGDQLWFRIIGPPGSGKTTIVEAISASRDHAYPCSIVKGFHSGYREISGKNKGKDASLIPSMNGRCVIIKDADTLVSSPNRDSILGELRDIYDGTSRGVYRNFTSHNYENLRMSFLFCGTDSLRNVDRAYLGERFLDCEIFGENTDVSQYVKRAANNAYNLFVQGMSQQGEGKAIFGEKVKRIHQVTVGLIEHLNQILPQRKPPQYSAAAKTRVESMATFLAYIRAKIEKTQDKKDALYEPRPEVPTRLVGQLTKLALSIAVVLNEPAVNARVLKIVKKVCFDTCKSYSLMMVRKMGESTTGCTREELAKACNLSTTAVYNYLQDLLRFGLIEWFEKKSRSGIVGREAKHYRLTEPMLKLYQEVCF